MVWYNFRMKSIWEIWTSFQYLLWMLNWEDVRNWVRLTRFIARRADPNVEARRSVGKKMIANLDKSNYEIVANMSRNAQENDLMTVAKMSYPKYDGSKHPVSWIRRYEKFFRIHKIKPINMWNLLAIIWKMMHTSGLTCWKANWNCLLGGNWMMKWIYSLEQPSMRIFTDKAQAGRNGDGLHQQSASLQGPDIWQTGRRSTVLLVDWSYN